MSDHPTALLDSDDVDAVREELHDRAGPQIIKLHGDLTAALSGSDAATRDYVSDYRALVGAVLEWVMLDEFHRKTVTHLGATAAAFSPEVVRDVLEGASAEAPFTPFAARYELGDAVAVDLLSRVRTLTGLRALQIPPAVELHGGLGVDDTHLLRFVRRVRFHQGRAEEPLARLMDSFALSKSDLGRLFDVSRQGIDGWMTHGVPAERQEKLTALLALADILERKLKADRVAGVFRRPADAYGGLSMFDMIAADRHQELLASVRASFDWSQAA